MEATANNKQGFIGTIEKLYYDSFSICPNLDGVYCDTFNTLEDAMGTIEREIRDITEQCLEMWGFVDGETCFKDMVVSKDGETVKMSVETDEDTDPEDRVKFIGYITRVD